jgi:ferredoxin-NADP reductase
MTTIYAASMTGHLPRRACTTRRPPAQRIRRGDTEPVTIISDSPTAAAPADSVAAGALIEIRVTAIRYAATGIHLFELESLDGTALPSYRPGAHIDLHLPNGLVRQYSLLVAKPEPDRYQIGVKRDPNSRGGSRYLIDELRVGQVLRISAPRNNFPLREDAGHSILIAGGIGITPIWCMVQHLEHLGRDWTLHYACRTRDEMAFGKLLADMSSARLHVDVEQDGRLLGVAAILAGAPRDAHLYCCGPAPMLAAFEAATADWPRDQIHIEYFTPKVEPARQGGFTVELARSGAEYFIPEGHSILAVLLDAGIDVDYSCELGICGACEQRVIAGIPHHHDAILTEEEQAENKRVMICCAGCRSERLVLDL